MLVLILLVFLVYPSSAQQLVSVEREACATLVIELPDNTTSIPVCVKLQLVLATGDQTANDIVIDVPVILSYGNTTVTRTVRVPLRVEGKVVRIYVKQVDVGVAESNGNIIWAVPQAETPTPAVYSPAPQAPATVTEYVYVTVTPQSPASQPAPTTITVYQPVPAPQPQGQDLTIPAIIVAVAIVASTIVLALTRRRPKPPPPQPQQPPPQPPKQAIPQEEAVLDTGDKIPPPPSH